MSFDRREYQRAWNAANRERRRAYSLQWAKEHPAETALAQRKHKLRKMYGITLEEYTARLAAQNGACAACGDVEAGGRWGVFCVDHDHESGAVRQLLCDSCNKATGFLKDSPERADLLAAYLRRHRS